MFNLKNWDVQLRVVLNRYFFNGSLLVWLLFRDNTDTSKTLESEVVEMDF